MRLRIWFNYFIVLFSVGSSYKSLGQTTIVNYDFNSGSIYGTPVRAADENVTSTATSTEMFATVAGIATGSAAFTQNTTPGQAVSTNNSNGTNIRYFQFALAGSSLSNYSGYKLYFQPQRSATGATTVTVAYSTDGGTNFTITSSTATVLESFSERVIDLSGLTILNNKPSVVLRLLLSGASGSGTFRLDNFQIQATSALNPVPVINNLTPASIGEGSNGFTLTVAGTGFIPSSVVRFNGGDRPTTFVSATQLTASVSAADVLRAGTYPVAVFTPAPGGGTSGNTAFTVTPVIRWDGGAGTNSWFDALNWSTDAVPTSNDEVLLDHTVVTGRYTVLVLPNGVTTAVVAPSVSVRSLTINPAAGDSILFEIPGLNTSTTPFGLTRSGATETALAIYNKGVVTNTSDQGTITIDGTNQVFYIYNGGTYRHYTDRPHAALVQNLATVAGTEAGNWEFRAKTQPSSTPSLAGRTYPNLIFRSRLGQPVSYGGSGSNPLTVRGNLIIGPGVTFAPDLNSELRVAGNMVVQGNFRFQPSQVTAPKLVFNGTKAQRISGVAWGSTTSPSYLGAGVALQISNTSVEGVTLATPITVNNALQLTAGRLNTDATNLLTLVNQPTGGSGSSFVNGPVARAASGPATLTFPVGRAGAQESAFRPLTLTITSLSRAVTFVASQTEGGFATQQLATGLERVSNTRHFTLAATAALAAEDGFAGTVTLAFGQDDRVTNPEAPSLVVARYNGSNWVTLGRSSSTGSAANGTFVSGTLTSGAFTSLGRFALASTDASSSQNPLPVTLTSFRAERGKGGVQLRWTTTTEIGNSRFEVQRSTDGRLFAPAATLAGQGNSQVFHAYSWLDTTPAACALYYRLRQVDADGTSSFSAVAVVPAEGTAAVIYPNPVQQQLTFHTSEINTTYRVINLLGQTVLKGQTHAGPNTVNIQRLVSGTYYLLLDNQRGKAPRSKFYKE